MIEWLMQTASIAVGTFIGVSLVVKSVFRAMTRSLQALAERAREGDHDAL